MFGSLKVSIFKLAPQILEHAKVRHNVCPRTLIRVLLIKRSKICQLVNENHNMFIILLCYTVCMKMFIKVKCVNSTAYYESTLFMYYDITDFLKYREVIMGCSSAYQQVNLVLCAIISDPTCS